MRTIQGKRALVTGAASGIGRAIATALAKSGADVWLLDIDREGLATTALELEKLGVDIQSSCCDVSCAHEVADAAREIIDGWGRLEILVNNAGVAYYGASHRMTRRQWDALLGVNLLGPIHLTRELLPTLLARGESHIVNVCSVAGLVPARCLAAYQVSKFGLVGFSEALRIEYASRGLGVTALCPGLVQTNLFRNAERDRANRRPPDPPAWICSTPDRVAAGAMRAIRKNRGLMMVSPMAHVFWFARRMSPRLLDLVSRFRRPRFLKRTGRPVANRAAHESEAQPADLVHGFDGLFPPVSLGAGVTEPLGRERQLTASRAG